MHWKLKALIQNAVGALPVSIGDSIYYVLQRRFGSLRIADPLVPLTVAAEAWQHISDLGLDPRGGVFLEIGTGRSVIVPLGYWLMGARRTITIDLYKHLKDEIVLRDLVYLRNHDDSVRRILGTRLQPDRLDKLIRAGSRRAFTAASLLATCAIDYRAPADAASTGLPSGSVDFHTSYTVLEHIPPPMLLDILREGNRVVKRGGLFVHTD